MRHQSLEKGVSKIKHYQKPRKYLKIDSNSISCESEYSEYRENNDIYHIEDGGTRIKSEVRKKIDAAVGLLLLRQIKRRRE